MFRKTLLTAALALVMTGCGGTEEDPALKADPEFLDSAPLAAAFEAEVTGDADAEGLSSSSQALTSGDGIGSNQQNLDGAPEYLVAVRNGVRGLNSIVRAAMVPIAELIRNNPDMKTGDTHVWGPADKGVGTWKFTMKRVAEKRYAWKLEGKAKGAADTDYKVVLAGGIKRNAEANRGRGGLGIDGDALASIDPSIKTGGKLLMGYWHGTRGAKSLSYALKEFTVNRDEHPPVSALFHAVRGPAGGTIVKMATYANVGSSPKADTRELVITRLRWLPGVGGRADAVALKGDVPADHVYLANACWTAQLEGGAKGYLLVRDYDKLTKDVTTLKEEGALANCKPALGGEQVPSEDPMAGGDEAAAEEGETEEVPATMPSGDSF